MKNSARLTSATRLPLERRIYDNARLLGLSRVLVAVSGGADSIALLSALSSSNVEIVAAHCNFHLRGEESDRDERHVASVCESLTIPLRKIDFDVPGFIAENKGFSLEMACRKLRYDWFFSLLDELKADRVATAHNADDNAETLFLNLLRGSGTAGLKGMMPDTGTIWRPLLSVTRREIEDYLSIKGIAFVTDSTNLESDYRRNFLRNEIIPLLRSRWEGFDKAMARSLSFMRSENSIVEKAVADALPHEGEPLPAETALSFPDPELLVRRFIQPLSPFTTTPSEI
ncbi:MAG: tRNA lysidine(34) synthetase TilS, partial [Muribaculaceae bacterium]|nr:tRNA lysidine(34) synthetase TilS [Muribaculaceae bacterium]